MDKPINPADPLAFLTEPNFEWTDERIKALIHFAPAMYKQHMLEIDKWRSGRVTRARAAAQAERERDAVTEGKKLARTIKA